MNHRDAIIVDFVDRLWRDGHLARRGVERWPDKDDRTTREIDAVAGNFAIEHTSIDTVPHQRRDSDWFRQVVGDIEQTLQVRPDFRLEIVAEYGAVAKGQNWPMIREAIAEWIINAAPKMPDGHHVLRDLAGVPFTLHVFKASDRPPRLVFGRCAPKDCQSVDHYAGQLHSKVQKLTKYHDVGYATVLIIESSDIALMNDSIMVEALTRVFPTGLPAGLDQIWYADTTLREVQFSKLTPRLGHRRAGQLCS